MEMWYGKEGATVGSGDGPEAYSMGGHSMGWREGAASVSGDA